MSNRVLVVGPSWLGDMVMTQSLFKILHKQGKVIDVLAPKWCNPILKLMPEVNCVINMPFEHGELSLTKRYQFAKTLKKYQYNESIVIPNSFKSAIIPFWAGIPKRTGWLGEFRHVILNNKFKLNKRILPLMVQRLVALAYINKDFNQEDVVKLDIPHPELKADSEKVQSLLTKYNLNTNRKTLILAPGAAYGEAKKWPVDYFAAVANEKLNNNWQVVIFGSVKDQETSQEINTKTDNRCLDLAGSCDLVDTALIISAANVVVSNDSGLLHVAAGFDVPLIGIYGSTSPDFTPPLISDNRKAILKLDNLSCRPCFQPTCKFGHYKCLYNISPRSVINAIDRLVPCAS